MFAAPSAKSETLAIVAIGSFNPAIFHPAWFSSQQLIRKEEFESAKIEIVHRDVCQFMVEWFSLQVTGDRFAMQTGDPAKGSSLRDLVSSTFAILEHTPISQVGLNRSRHFEMPSTEDWHHFGHFFAPKAGWAGILVEPGLQSLTITGKRQNSKAALVSVRVEPSAEMSPGVFIHVNEHFNIGEAEDDEARRSPRAFNELLRTSWDDFMSFSSNVSTHLFNKYQENDN